MPKVDINNRFIRAVELLLQDKGLTKASIAQTLGIKPAKFSEILNNRMNAGVDLIAGLCEQYSYSATWLLTGEGPVLNIGPIKGRSKPAIAVPLISDLSQSAPIENTSKPEAIPFAEASRNGLNPIPLVTQRAAAGFGNADFSIAEDDVKEYYVIPKFKYCHVDFMIEVSGLSMYPHFNSGDVIACSILRNTGFIQWNKCHVIATREQGILVKRLMPGEDKKNLRAISDNKEYPPFEIPVDEITGIAIVVGSVGLE